MLLALILFCFQTDAKDTDFQGVGTRWKAASNTLFSMPYSNFLQAWNSNAYPSLRLALPMETGPVPPQEQVA